MKEVTKDEFYKVIKDNGLDVCVSVRGDYPYTNDFIFRNGSLFGRVEPIIKNRNECDYKKYHNGFGERYLINDQYAKAKEINIDGIIKR